MIAISRYTLEREGETSWRVKEEEEEEGMEENLL